MGDATVNGDMPQSAILNHIHSYPVVSDSVSAFKENPYGSKSIDLTNTGYAKLVKPALPYFETPASYAKPYVAKADELGDKFLSKIDERVPMLKTETKEIKGTITSFIYWPITKTTETKDWALKTYDSEYKKCGGDGIVAGGKALVTTPLILGSDVLQWLSSFLAAKKEETKQVLQEKASKAQEKATN